jgi:hypothetical protein
MLQCIVPGGTAHTATRIAQLAGVRTVSPTQYEAVEPTSLIVAFVILTTVGDIS